MGIFIHHEPCPKCGSKDNLARYADGSAWCFGGCGYREKANRIPVNNVKHREDECDNLLQLDDDLCLDFPGHVVSWLARYDVSIEEAIRYGWKYAPKRDQLVFIFREPPPTESSLSVRGVSELPLEGRVACIQARNFWEGAKTKYYNQGSPAEVLPIFYSPGSTGSSGRTGPAGGCQTPKRLVVVEDAVSAARIARQSDAMPCLGSHLPRNKMMALRALGYEQMAFWLDSDKLNEARRMADTAKWIGFKTRVIYTMGDPKEYSDGEIKAILQGTPP